LSNIENDGEFVDSNFVRVPPKASMADSSQQQVDQDYLLALSLQEEAKKEEKKIQDMLEKEEEKLAAMTPEQRKVYENSISKKISSANIYLTDGCNHHLESIKDILRSFGGVGDMTSYDDAKNAALREKFKFVKNVGNI